MPRLKKKWTCIAKSQRKGFSSVLALNFHKKETLFIFIIQSELKHLSSFVKKSTEKSLVVASEYD